MPLFVSSTIQARHDVFAIEKKPPAMFTPQGTDAACIVGAFPWGPSQVATLPGGPKDLLDTVAPPGMDRTNSAVLGVLRKAFPFLYFVRVAASTAVAASAVFPNGVPTNIVTVTAKSVGTAGNSIVGTIANADDADPNHFNLTVTVTGVSGSTTETVKNINLSGVNPDSIPDFSTSLLIGTIVKNAAGRPVNGSVTFSGGTTPAIGTSDYVGTAGAGDKGIALLEGQRKIRHFFTDDPGNTNRAAINAGGMAHAILMGERVFYLNGNSGQTAAQVQTDSANYRSDRIMYLDPWVRIRDENGNKTLVPSASFAASVATQLPPSTSIAWKDPEVQAMLSGIVELEADRGQNAGVNTSFGIATFIKEESGGTTLEADVNGDYPVDVTLGYNTRRRMTDFIALTFVKGARPFVDSPNLTSNQQGMLNALSRFMDELKANADDLRDPNHNPHVVDWGIGDLSSVNSKTSIAAGKFSIPLDVQDSSGMYQIFLNINSGTGVTVTH